ncbi:MAG: hypothetical protein QW331_04570 [Candidatus Woesearchaeota archaeon]
MHWSISEWKLKAAIYATFNRDEIVGVLLSSVVFGFMFAFRDWNTVTEGVLGWGISIIIVLLSLIVHEYAHKLSAISVGFKSTFKPSWTWIWGTLAACFVTNGFLVAPINGTIELKLAGRQRLGHFRYGLNYWASGVVSFLGPFSNLLLAIIFKTLLLLSPDSIILQKALVINISMAIFNILPLPKVDGLLTFYSNLMFYVTMFFGVVLAGGLLLFLNPVYAILFSLITSFIIFLIYFYFEVKA